MARRRTEAGARPRGLSGLRRPGAVTELLFLFECLTQEPTQLRPVAEQLGLTVQAASYVFRGLAPRGLAEFHDGRYRVTVAGVAQLHDALGGLAEDLQDRLGRLYVVRSTRAIAGAPLLAGQRVSLELIDGVLTARPGDRGPSKGRTKGPGRAGELVEIVELEGIVPLTRGTIRVLTLPEASLGARGLVSALRRALGPDPRGLLAAAGLESYHILRRATDRSVLRFGIAAACREASRVGVPSTVIALDRELPRLLGPFEGEDPPPVEVQRIRVPSAAD